MDWAIRVFVRLSCQKIPTPAEKQVLQKAGLGLKKIKFSVKDDEVTVYNQLTGTVESDETAGHPQLKNCGPNSKALEPTDVVMSAKNLKATAGQGKIYIRPIQRSLSVISLKSETSSFSSSVLKEKCVYCLKEFPLQSLRAHVLTCLSSSYLSGDDANDVREGEDSAPPDVEPRNDNNSESNRSLEVSNNISGSEITDVTDTLEETNMSTVTIVNSENEIKDIIIDKEIVDIIEHCKTKDLNNSVEILKYIQTRLVQGRPLEIEDVTQCIGGATNFIMVDRSDLMNTGLEEIQQISNKFVTLEVQFYNEVMIMVFNSERI